VGEGPQPADRCPYPKPFPDDFRECAAYQPVRYIPLDTAYKPLRPIWSCAHLEIGSHDGRSYTACRLGGPSERHAWVQRMRSDRIERWRAVATEFGESLKDLLAAVYAAKAAQVASLGTPAQAEADRELRRAVQEFIERDFELMDRRAGELGAIGFPVDAMKTVTTSSMEALIARPRVVGTYEPPAELLAPFSAEIADFVRGLFASPPGR
jgi:hypothetical protein